MKMLLLVIVTFKHYTLWTQPLYTKAVEINKDAFNRNPKVCGRILFQIPILPLSQFQPSAFSLQLSAFSFQFQYFSSLPLGSQCCCVSSIQCASFSSLPSSMCTCNFHLGHSVAVCHRSNRPCCTCQLCTPLRVLLVPQPQLPPVHPCDLL